MKRIILFENGIETLSFFSKQLAKAFEKENMECFLFDLEEEEKSFFRLKKFIKEKETVLLTFNFNGLRGEQVLYDSAGELYWKKWKIPCINIMVDHPFYYHESLEKVKKELGFDLYYQINIDRDHENYMNRFFKEIENIFFLPLAGNVIEEGLEHEKEYSVVFTGNYTPPKEFRKYIERINDEYTAFYDGIIKTLIENPNLPMEQAFEEGLLQEMGSLSEKEVMKCMESMIFIDLYVRFYFRGMVIKTLVDAGIKVHVFGSGWEKLECIHRENLIIKGQTDSCGCVKAMQKAKIALNVMPWFKNGSHDRVYTAMLNKALIVTVPSIYLKEDMEDGKQGIFYELSAIHELPQKMKELLEDSKGRERIVEHAYIHSIELHTWEQRAKEIKKIIVTI